MSGYALSLLLVGIFGFALLMMAVLHKPRTATKQSNT